MAARPDAHPIAPMPRLPAAAAARACGRRTLGRRTRARAGRSVRGGGCRRRRGGASARARTHVPGGAVPRHPNPSTCLPSVVAVVVAARHGGRGSGGAAAAITRRRPACARGRDRTHFMQEAITARQVVQQRRRVASAQASRVRLRAGVCDKPGVWRRPRHPACVSVRGCVTSVRDESLMYV